MRRTREEEGRSRRRTRRRRRGSRGGAGGAEEPTVEEKPEEEKIIYAIIGEGSGEDRFFMMLPYKEGEKITPQGCRQERKVLEPSEVQVPKPLNSWQHRAQASCAFTTWRSDRPFHCLRWRFTLYILKRTWAPQVAYRLRSLGIVKNSFLLPSEMEV